MAVLDLAQVTVRSRDDWRRWLSAHHTQAESIWLVTFKKGDGRPHVSYPEIVEEALCFGWIDSKANRLDDQRSMLLMAPRRKGSAWSKLNKDRVDQLIAAGLMTEAGLRKIREAKADGTWTFLDDVDNLVIPADLRDALVATPRAEAYFEAFPRSVKRGILEWIKNAKKPETRAKRVAQTAELAGQNVRAQFATAAKKP